MAINHLNKGGEQPLPTFDGYELSPPVVSAKDTHVVAPPDSAEKPDLVGRQLFVDVLRHYKTNEQPEVQSFLLRHPSVCPILLQTVPLLVEKFGENASFWMEVSEDLEFPDDTDLYIEVESVNDNGRAMVILSEFYANWTQKFTKEQRKNIVINIKAK